LKQGVDFDITSASTRRDYCFALDTTSIDSVVYNSREATTGKPSVALTWRRLRLRTGPGADHDDHHTAPAPTTTTTLPPRQRRSHDVADTYVHPTGTRTSEPSRRSSWTTGRLESRHQACSTPSPLSVSGVGVKHVSTLTCSSVPA